MTVTSHQLDVLARMTTRQKVGHLLMAPLDAANYETMLGEFCCGSLIVWSPKSEQQFADPLGALVNQAQAVSLAERGLPVWMHGCTGGLGWRPGWLTQAARNASPEETEAVANIFGKRWRAVGLHNCPEPVLNVRLFDTGIMLHWDTKADAATVARYGLAVTRGLTAARCGSMAQHFPAHGATPLDSHTAYPVVELDRETLMRDHLQSYKDCFDAGCTTICTAHLACPALDPDPAHMATTSRPILTDFLRGELGFRGVAIADAVEMYGYTKNGPIDRVSVDAVNAGCDSLCLCSSESVKPIFTALLAAAESGTITEERLNEAVLRNLAFMDWLGILDGDVMVSTKAAADLLQDAADNRLIARVLAEG
ncbi:MAG: glycoside hydrolase family 3 N-terminal domain-containing protein [Armatimonadota bacterium]